MTPRKTNVKYRKVPISEMHLHPELNRERRPGRVRQLRETMNLDALGTFSLWEEPGTGKLWVVDGQHRKGALEGLELEDWPAHSAIYFDMTFAEACELFLLLNDGMKIRPYDRFDKGVKAGRREYVETKRIVEASGWKIGKSGARDGYLSCVEAALATYKLDDGVSLGEALDLIVSAFGFKPEAAEGNLIRGLGLVFNRHNGQVDRAAFSKKMAKFSGRAAGILGAAKGRREHNQRAIAYHVANVAIDEYNKGRRVGRLDPV